MTSGRLSITGVRIRQPSPKAREFGVLAWVEFVVSGELRVEGASVRRDADGTPALVMPYRLTGPTRAERPIVRLLTEEAQRRLEAEVLAALCDAQVAKRPRVVEPEKSDGSA